MLFPFWVWSLGRELMLEWSTVRCKLRARHSPYIFFWFAHVPHVVSPLHGSRCSRKWMEYKRWWKGGGISIDKLCIDDHAQMEVDHVDLKKTVVQGERRWRHVWPGDASRGISWQVWIQKWDRWTPQGARRNMQRLPWSSRGGCTKKIWNGICAHIGWYWMYIHDNILWYSVFIYHVCIYIYTPTQWIYSQRELPVLDVCLNGVIEHSEQLYRSCASWPMQKWEITTRRTTGSGATQNLLKPPAVKTWWTCMNAGAVLQNVLSVYIYIYMYICTYVTCINSQTFFI